MKRWLVLITVVFLVTSCGRNGHSYLEWPATLAEVSSFSGDQTSIIMRTIETVNSRTTRGFILAGSSQTKSGIFIRRVPTIPDPKTRSTIAARATIEVDRCTIEITDRVATDIDLLESVLLHELGHCAELGHHPMKGQVMYKDATPLSQLAPSAIDSFFSQLHLAIGAS